METPVLIATWSFALRGIERAWPQLLDGGDAIDAVETVCRTAEDDPSVDSVGYGGLPDRDGDMTLDACVMLSPRACGSVCAIARHRHAVTVARRVMEGTEHVMLAGPGADQFADEIGLAEEPMLAPAAKDRWIAWRKRPDPVDQSRDGTLLAPRPVDRGDGSALFSGAGHDTVGVLALDTSGVLAGACSTSGTPYKLPGRVGDSPIIGHGLYVDPAAGAATATGSGELIMTTCGSFLAVEEMRRGASAGDAIAVVLRRIASEFTLCPRDQVGLIALRPDGTWAAGALRTGFKASLATSDGTGVIDPELILVEGS